MPAFIVGPTSDVEPGEFLCLLGPNGAGKSTLLRTVAGEQAPLVGSVHLHGTDIHPLPKAALAKLVSVVLTERIACSLITSSTWLRWDASLTPAGLVR